MSDRKAVNKYYPPEWTPAQGSINKFRNSHPLRDRARKLHLGILVIRFELPYNIWCGGCKEHIGMGVRYNAEKTKVGMYYSTIIYKFRMKCHLCDNYFEIQTDPENCDYKIISGATKKNEKWDLAENEQVVTTDRDDRKKMAVNAMFKLEHGVDDEEKSKTSKPRIAEIVVKQEVWDDDYMANKRMRQKFRTEKKSLIKCEEEDSELLRKASLDIPLLPEQEQDRREAAATLFKQSEFEEKKLEKRMEIMSRPLFKPDNNSPLSSASKTTMGKESKLQHTLDIKQRLQSSVGNTRSISTDWALPTRYTSLGIVRKRKRNTSTPVSDSKHHKDVPQEPMTSSGVVGEYQSASCSHIDPVAPDQSATQISSHLSGCSSVSHETINQPCDDLKRNSLSLINSYDNDSSSGDGEVL